jgi:peptidoglycan/xylan/chitin deacetylase (PgdA/CDA1 family)
MTHEHRIMAGRGGALRWLAAAAVAAAAALTAAGPAAAQAGAPCANPNALGISRTVEIDTTGGPAFGFEQYKVYDFLQPKEVVLTFDDGPQVRTTHAVLAALATHCTKATFFSVGKMALGMPEILREVARAGHTVGSHTWSHANLRKAKGEKAWKDEIERAVSAVHRAVGGPTAPFFRFPYLADSPDTLKYLASRNISPFSVDVDSFDFKHHKTEQIIKTLLTGLEKKGKGIILMHDIQPKTAAALPAVLDALKANGYKIVHMRAKSAVATVPEYDALIEKDVKGLPPVGAERPITSVVRTVGGDNSPPAAPAAPATPVKK